MRERTRLEVRLESDGDRQAWSTYAIVIDDHRTLEEVRASVRRPDGSVVRLGSKELDVVDAPGAEVLHGSQRLRTLRFPVAPIGSVLSVEHIVIERPYFPSGWLPVGGADAVESLSLEVRGPAADLRWRLDGELPGLKLEEEAGRIRVSAAWLPAVQRPEASPLLAAHGAVLRYAWGPAKDWASVAGWYEKLLHDLPRQAAIVRQKAAEVAGRAAGGAQRVDGLLGFVRGAVRYVAVEVGIGGYRPSPPAEVLARGWGDCKDKAVLLIDMLAAQGIEAHPALIGASPDERVDRGFPSPDQFNHMIVAIPTASLGLDGEHPVAGGYLFVDPTQPSGGLGWLHPGLQDQEALVVAGAKSALVRLPIRPQSEGRQVRVSLTLDASGDAEGELQVELTGSTGLRFAGLAEQSATAQHAEALVREELGRFLPAARLEGVGWAPRPLGADLSARVRVSGLAIGSVSRSFALPALPRTPPPSLLEGRTVPVVLAPAVSSETWTLRLPPGWCAPRPQARGVDNSAGAFRLAIGSEGSATKVERTLAIRAAWVGPAGFADLKELALAEHQAARRRIRFDCQR